MKFVLLIAIALLVGCAGASPNRSLPNRSNTINDGIRRNSFDNDVIDCERRAAVATIGSKGEAFASCMRARGHTRGR